jgi:hypothetical protein
VTEAPIILGRRSRSFEEASASPCLECASSPCCRFLPVHSFTTQTLLDLDHVRYLLNFERIEVGYNRDGRWIVHYRVPCRNLDLESYLCTVHGTADQPHVCVNYNPYRCWYRPALGDQDLKGFIRVDRARLDAILAATTFDEYRAIETFPSYDEIHELAERLPIAEETIEHLPAADATDPVIGEWHAIALGRRPAPPEEVPMHRFGDPRVATPCEGCSAACCTKLVFPFATPSTVSAFDFLRFSLGFPGTEVGIAEDGWSLVVSTRCRHLTADARCGVFDQPERPLLCRYYDAVGCTYKPRFTVPAPEGYLRVRYEELPWLAECFRFDDAGGVVLMATLGEMQAHVETRLIEAKDPDAAASS